MYNEEFKSKEKIEKNKSGCCRVDREIYTNHTRNFDINRKNRMTACCINFCNMLPIFVIYHVITQTLTSSSISATDRTRRAFFSVQPSI